MSEENKNLDNTENENVGEDNELCQTDTDLPTVFEDSAKTPKKIIKFSLKTFILSSISLILATFMLTYTICSGIYQKQLADIYADAFESGNNSSNNGASSSLTGFSEFELIDILLDSYFYNDGSLDKSKLTEASLKAYLAATGDIYAAYYTQEELDASNDEGAGRMYGIGVNIINSTVTINGKEYAVLKIINVMKDSPAQESGLRTGDLIAYAGVGSKRESVEELGYDDALKKLKGEENTKAEFTILRKSGEDYLEKEFSVTRRQVTTESVYYRVYSRNSKIGIIKITGFELKTPEQFCEAVEALKNQGCEKFVIDVRNNPGGYELSVAAILSYFLEEGDVYIRTKNSKGVINEKKVGVVSSLNGDYAGCNVTKEDIGKYKNLDMVVLCNENTASAGELFTATFRDYGLGKIIGTTTFGKGKMQTTYSLSAFGLEGAVKFTTHMYYSAKSEGYDGIGIKPDYLVELSEEAAEYNIYDLPDEKDNQLQEAMKHFN